MVWNIGLLEDVTSTNIWAILATAATVDFYVFKNQYPSLYRLSDFHFSWVPLLADGKPGALTQEGDLWTMEVALKEGVLWSDGKEITAAAVAFTVNTALALELPGKWAQDMDPNLVNKAEAQGTHTVKFYLNAKPGLARWEYGLSQALVAAKHYWEPVVDAAKGAGPIEDQHKALFDHVPQNEPTAGPLMLDSRDPGFSIVLKRNPNYYWAGSTVKEYANGAYVEEKPGVFEFKEGDPVLELTRGPHVTEVRFTVYEEEIIAVTELRSDLIDYLLSPRGINISLRKHLEGGNVVTFENPANQIVFMGFNTVRAPMTFTPFRQAMATLIDREFLTNVVLKEIALPLYTMVPEGNKFWYNPDVPQFGRELTREERINDAIALLETTGFSWDAKPRWDSRNRQVVPGVGLKMPDGQPVPEIELLAPSEAADPMRAAAAEWTETWLNEAGIPVKATFFDNPREIIGKVFGQRDFDIFLLGTQLDPFPGHLVDLFHSTAPFNAGGYNNPQFDATADEFLAESDLDAAQAKAFELQRLAAQDVPLLALFAVPILEAYRGGFVLWSFTEVLNGVQAYFENLNGPLSYTRLQE